MCKALIKALRWSVSKQLTTALMSVASRPDVQVKLNKHRLIAVGFNEQNRLAYAKGMIKMKTNSVNYWNIITKYICNKLHNWWLISKLFRCSCGELSCFWSESWSENKITHCMFFIIRLQLHIGLALSILLYPHYYFSSCVWGIGGMATDHEILW